MSDTEVGPLSPSMQRGLLDVIGNAGVPLVPLFKPR